MPAMEAMEHPFFACLGPRVCALPDSEWAGPKGLKGRGLSGCGPWWAGLKPGEVWIGQGGNECGGGNHWDEWGGGVP